jgi:hypothetical protein
MNDFAEQLITKIKTDKVTPWPRWVFTVRTCALWFFGGAALLLAATSCATIIHVIRINDWDVYRELADNLASFVITTIPYAWFIILSVLLASGYVLFVRTPRGYRYRLITVTMSGLIVSSLLGSVMYAAGVGEQVDEYIRTNAPTYHAMLNPHSKTWQQPHNGRLAGDVVEIAEKSVVVRDERGVEWQIESDEKTTSTVSFTAEQETPHRLRVIGTMINSSTFKAKKIFGDVIPKHAAYKPIVRREKPNKEQEIKPEVKKDSEKKSDDTNEKKETLKIKITSQTSTSTATSSTSTTKKRNRRWYFREDIKDLFEKK